MPNLPPFVSTYIYLSALITLATFVINLSPSDPDFITLHREVLNHFSVLNTSLISAQNGDTSIPAGVIERAVRVLGLLIDTHGLA
jgi:hypothetical protein